MKKKANITAILALVLAGGLYGLASTSKGAIPQNNTAQNAARQAQLEQEMAAIMPPTPVTTTTKKSRATATALTASSTLDAQASPMAKTTQPPIGYELIDLGDLGGGSSIATAINSKGQVVGYSSVNATTTHAFLYTNGVMQDLGTVAGGDQSLAYGINDSGIIVGGMTPLNHAVEYVNGQWVDLNQSGATNTMTLASARSINNSNEIAGFGFVSGTGGRHGFVYRNGLIEDLGTISDVSDAINDSGQIVSTRQIQITDSGNSVSIAAVAFIYSNGVFQNITPTPIVSLPIITRGYAINDKGEVAGSIGLTNGSQHAALYADEILQDIDTMGSDLSIAYGINGNRQVVGMFTTENAATHAFLYSDGVMQDLNNLVIASSSGWALSKANAINDSGEIVGYGTSPDGKPHAFLLRPYVKLTYASYHQGDAHVTGSGVPLVFGNAGASAYGGIASSFDANGRPYTSYYGCTLCSVSMMLTSLSSLPSLQNITPAELNAALTNIADGYDNGDAVNMPAIGRAVGCSSLKEFSEQVSDPSLLDQKLQDYCWGDRYRVVLQLRSIENNSSVNTHYVFVVGRTNGDWIVADPGWHHALLNGVQDDSVLSSLNAHYAGFSTLSSTGTNSWRFVPRGIRAFSVENGPVAYAQYTVLSPVELLVVAPDGSRTGYDPVTSSNVFEIPGASYGVEYPLLNAEQDGEGSGETNGVKSIVIPSPVGGGYSVISTGTGSGSYSLNGYAYWPLNGGVSQTMASSGTASVGSLSTNSMFVVVPPVITGTSSSAGSFSLSFTAQPNVGYAIDGRESLTEQSWTTLHTLVATNANMTITQPATNGNMFYRVRSL